MLGTALYFLFFDFLSCFYLYYFIVVSFSCHRINEMKLHFLPVFNLIAIRALSNVIHVRVYMCSFNIDYPQARSIVTKSPFLIKKIERKKKSRRKPKIMEAKKKEREKKRLSHFLCVPLNLYAMKKSKHKHKRTRTTIRIIVTTVRLSLSTPRSTHTHTQIKQ